MATLSMTYADIEPFLKKNEHTQAKVELVIQDTLARIINHVPQLGIALDESQVRSALAITRTVIIRQLDRGSGAITTQNHSQSTGGFSTQDSTTIDNTRNSWFLWPSEIAELKAIVANESPSAGKAFSVDMLGGL